MILLQVDQAGIKSGDVTQLSKAAIELAEATSNYGALKVIFGIFMVVVLCLLLFFIYQTWYLLNNIKNISSTSNKVATYFDNLANNTVGKDEARVLLRSSLNQAATLIKYYILRIRIENHIDNEVATKDKVARIVDNMNAETKNFLGQFWLYKQPIGDILDFSKDSDTIQTLILEQVYIPMDRFTISSMDQLVSLFIDGLKLQYVSKIEKL